MLFITVPIFLVCFIVFLPPYTRIGRLQASLSLVAAGVLSAFYCLRRRMHPGDSSEVEGLAATAACVLITAFAIRLWGCWVGDLATEAERQPGKAGLRAWFCPSNIVVGITIAVLAHMGFGISPLVSSMVLAMLLAASPLLKMDWAQADAASQGPQGPDLSVERDKIFSMLSAGKITAEESAELLQALGASAPSPVQDKLPLGRRQRLLLIGSWLVLLGFFLPWFTINPSREANRMFRDVASAVPNGIHFPQQLEMPANVFGTRDIVISGGDIRNHLGWATLLLALGVAFLPNLCPRLDETTIRTIRLAALGMGALILLYVLSGNLRSIGVGLVLAASGYALQIVGTLAHAKAWIAGHPHHAS